MTDQSLELKRQAEKLLSNARRGTLNVRGKNYTGISLKDSIEVIAELLANEGGEQFGNGYIIMHQGKPWRNLLFTDVNQARNYIVMQMSKRKFKEIRPNVLSCTRYGSTFEIIELQAKTTNK